LGRFFDRPAPDAPLLDRNALQPPLLREIAQAIGEDMKKTELALRCASRYGLVLRVSQSRFFVPSVLRPEAEAFIDKQTPAEI